MRLSKNFALSEFVKSQAAERLGIDNTPSQVVVNNLKLLVSNVLQPVRDHYDKTMVISSGYRSPALNKAVGGARTSDHMTGCAADIEIPGVANYDLAVYIRDNLPFTQVILEFYTPGIPDSGWVHVSYDSGDLRKQTLTATRKDGKTVYLQRLTA
jgi:zinc D-Ala-D-Ala carboxypeptidase